MDTEVRHGPVSEPDQDEQRDLPPLRHLRHLRTRLRAALPEWWPVLAGLALLFGPTFHGLFTGAWISEEQGHGPIIFALALWLIYRKWPAVQAVAAARAAGTKGQGKIEGKAHGRLEAGIRDIDAGKGASQTAGQAAGWSVLALGLACYLLGRSQKILMFEIASIILVMAAVLLVKRGAPALRVLWFPFFFMLFMVPLPAEFVAAVTMPMKMAVSWATEHILYALGYPIGRSGVILQIGQYQLLVADACAGLQTLLTLEALGLFYLNLMRHPSAVRNIGLAVFIVLTLVTYYFGDAAGQGFLHGFAGMVLFVTALVLILALDTALQWCIRGRAARRPRPAGEAA
jgi:exosortase B